MKDALKKLVSVKFMVVWFSLLVLLIVVLTGRVWLVGQQPPTLEQVLARQTESTSPDLSALLASLLALSLATMSAAKGYEIFKRNRSLTCVLPEAPARPDASEKSGGEIETLRGDVDELSRLKEWLQQENSELKERFGNLSSEVEEITRAEKMLRKSNISLSKECERLKAENEMLLLKISSISLKPKGSKNKAKAGIKAKSKGLTRRKRKTSRKK
ncbi:MAG: hypothetical protein JW782_02330 [Candidatus Saganbacteria bacterium]|nr:hypothetical protein [Candidatus Saganbacteria bacterium]